MSVTFSFGLEPDLRLAEAELGGVCFSVPPFPIGAKLLQEYPRPCSLLTASALIAFHPLAGSDSLVNRNSGFHKPGLQS